MTMKCVIWDLDNTLWDGVLLEDAAVTMRSGAVDVIRILDERGILHSIASRGDHDAAMAKLNELGLAEYFLHPQINWGPKSRSVLAVASALNLGVAELAFVDDQPFERDEVRFALPAVRCIDAADVAAIPAMPDMRPRFVTDSSRQRRRMYQAEARRAEAEQAHAGTPEEFLASLDMRLSIGPARERDLQRAEELTVRTNQLNSTGYTYSYEELEAFRTSPDHDLLIAGLDDKYGGYGKIGLALVERGQDTVASFLGDGAVSMVRSASSAKPAFPRRLGEAGVSIVRSASSARTTWTIKLLLMSCRVMARGVGMVLLNHIVHRAARAGVRLLAEFVPTDRNRAMYVTYRFCGFRETAVRGEVHVLENGFAGIQDFPSYMDITIEGGAG